VVVVCCQLRTIDFWRGIFGKVHHPGKKITTSDGWYNMQSITYDRRDHYPPTTQIVWYYAFKTTVVKYKLSFFYILSIYYCFTWWCFLSLVALLSRTSRSFVDTIPFC
jgi:hypothetical protein